ncbi:hypothetical protein ASF58_09505 [Methylobacterium sp. Leaf125]|uniref:glycosyltransferase family 2 protein n=1 Tax=Methylobacterium sp. Leaf125 TaxID=1736265 RepID=UPI0006F963C4|nr:glycosyltransferase [Methylobacterium sp. Leaf125]KQQ41146.1 hypothetical protein ASF58_09505 [Methylobacterium sp. Leaf125]
MSKPAPIVSFIVTFYQQKAFIGQTIRSALEQKLDGIEVIAVDDGSTDGGAERVKEIRDPRLTLIVQDNRGPSLAANSGINAARGEYIALLGGDDIALPQRAVRQYDLVSKGYADIVFDVPQLINETDLPLEDSFYPAFSQFDFNRGNRVSLDHLFFRGNFLCAPSVFMRRSTFLQVGPFSPGLIQLQDFEYWIRCLKHGFVLRVVRDRLTAYRRRGVGLNLSASSNMARLLIEDGYIMRHFFDGMDLTSLRRHFAEHVPFHFTDTPADIALAKALIYLHDSRRTVSNIAFEILIDALQRDPSVQERAASVGLTMPVIFSEMLRRGDPSG